MYLAGVFLVCSTQYLIPLGSPAGRPQYFCTSTAYSYSYSYQARTSVNPCVTLRNTVRVQYVQKNPFGRQCRQSGIAAHVVEADEPT